MANFLDGKIAVITGGTRGIGRAIADALLEQGASVAICGRSQDAVRRVVENMAEQYGGKVVGKAADVRRAEDVQALFRYVDEALGGVDILVNNAGVGIFGKSAELSVEDWQRTLETNLSGAFYCSREALARLRNRGGGYIINVSSLAGKNAFAGGAAYNASKFGLNGFSEALMLDHRYDNVRVTYIMPGSVATEFGGEAAGGANWKMAPEDVASVVLMLLRMPERTTVSRVEMRPSKPKK